jgi:SAM-dependent methyltransferase
MGENETGQVSDSAAEIYEEFYLSAMFEEWPARVIEAARIESGQQVVDVACGTGVLTLAVAKQVGAEGAIVGVDINAGMLKIAREKAPEIEWRQASAEALPLDDESFDCAVSQFGLMYFENQQTALQEMMRVLRPGGILAVVVWDKLENIPGLAAEEELWQRLFGDEAADEAPYSLGDLEVLQKLFTSAGIPGAKIRTCEGTVRFPSIEAWIYAGAKGWTQDDMIDDEKYEILLREAHRELTSFARKDGAVSFSAPGHIVTARKPAGAR